MLTDTKLKNLKPADKLYKISDRDGLYVAVTKSGTVSFRYDYRINGRRETITFGRYGRDGISLSEAREMLLEAKKMVSAGKSPALNKKEKKKSTDVSMTFSFFADKYFADTKFAESTLNLKLSVLRRDIEPVFGRYLMTEITPSQVRAQCERVVARGARATAVQVREIIQAIFIYAINRGYDFINPAESIRASTIAKFEERTRALTPKEIGIFLNGLDEVGGMPNIKMALRMVFLTLVRKSEILKAKWDEVDFDTAVWTIPAERMKANRAHNIYLSDMALDLFVGLKACSGPSEFVLPSRYDFRKCMSNAALNNLIDNALKKLGSLGVKMEHFTVHDIRRTGSTLLHEMGFNTDWIEKCLAHEQRGVRAVYNKAEYSEQRRDMLNQWAKLIDEWKSSYSIPAIS